MSAADKMTSMVNLKKQVNDLIHELYGKSGHESSNEITAMVDFLSDSKGGSVRVAGKELKSFAELSVTPKDIELLRKQFGSDHFKFDMVMKKLADYDKTPALKEPEFQEPGLQASANSGGAQGRAETTPACIKVPEQPKAAEPVPLPKAVESVTLPPVIREVRHTHTHTHHHKDREVQQLPPPPPQQINVVIKVSPDGVTDENGKVLARMNRPEPPPPTPPAPPLPPQIIEVRIPEPAPAASPLPSPPQPPIQIP